MCVEQEAVVVSEAPDNETVATLALAAARSGCEPRPIGARGLYAFWRTGGGALVANAARYLEVKYRRINGWRLLRGVALAVRRRSRSRATRSPLGAGPPARPCLFLGRDRPSDTRQPESRQHFLCSLAADGGGA